MCCCFFFLSSSPPPSIKMLQSEQDLQVSRNCHFVLLSPRRCLPPPAPAFFFQHAGKRNNTVAPRRRCGFAARVSLWQLFRPRKEADGWEPAGREQVLSPTCIAVSLRCLSSGRMSSLPSEQGGRALARNYGATRVLTRARFGAERPIYGFYVEHLLPRLLPICFTFIYNPGRI